MTVLPRLSIAQAAPTLPVVQNVELQPLIAQVKRVMEATEYLGMPLAAQDTKRLHETFSIADPKAASELVQGILDRYCLLGVHINPEMRVSVTSGEAKPELVEGGWRQFLVKVHNEAGTTAALRGASPQAQSVFSYEALPLSPEELNREAQFVGLDATVLKERLAKTRHDRPYGLPSSESDTQYRSDNSNARDPSSTRDFWLDLQMFDAQPLSGTLSGLALEYRIIQLYSRDAGYREATLAFNVGQGTQDLGFRNETPVLFECLPAQSIRLRVREGKESAVMAAFVIRDAQGRVYPSQAKRLAPDFSFHPQVYRADGEVLKLPAGAYTLEFWRGPESHFKTRQLVVQEGRGTTTTQEEVFEIERWIDPSKSGYWSGDHHIHAAGCRHYRQPTEGVLPEDVVRHMLGEDLKVGSALVWGPGFDYQKQFFSGRDHAVSRPSHVVHYDLEVSGFGSQGSGHLVLLGLTNLDFRDGDSDQAWPTLCLNTLKWAKQQGAVCGFAHSGFGLQPAADGETTAPWSMNTQSLRLATQDLPNDIVPPFNGNGAMEYIVDVTHTIPGPDGKWIPAVDFISVMDSPHIWELNIWYHTLNVGFRTRIAGETDFPCVYGERVGMGRSYVKLEGKLNYRDWCRGIQRGGNYVSDGKSHLLEFKVGATAMGENGSELNLDQPSRVRITVKAAALLDELPRSDIRRRPYTAKPFWDIERARIGETRQVPVEVVVNGMAVAKKIMVADGTVRELAFEVPIERSSWVAVRILPSSHTNPVFVMVGGKPIRASRRSAEWCLKGVDQCWSQKQRFIKSKELVDAKAAYAQARQTYRRRLAESEVD